MLPVIRKYTNLFLESLEKFGDTHIPDHSRHTYQVVVSVLLIFFVVQGMRVFMEMFSVPFFFALLIVIGGLVFFGLPYLNKDTTNDTAEKPEDKPSDSEDHVSEVPESTEEESVWPHEKKSGA